MRKFIFIKGGEGNWRLNPQGKATIEALGKDLYYLLGIRRQDTIGSFFCPHIARLSQTAEILSGHFSHTKGFARKCAVKYLDCLGRDVSEKITSTVIYKVSKKIRSFVPEKSSEVDAFILDDRIVERVAHMLFSNELPDVAITLPPLQDGEGLFLSSSVEKDFFGKPELFHLTSLCGVKRIFLTQKDTVTQNTNPSQHVPLAL
jgi:hypothetical protein